MKQSSHLMTAAQLQLSEIQNWPFGFEAMRQAHTNMIHLCLHSKTKKKDVYILQEKKKFN